MTEKEVEEFIRETISDSKNQEELIERLQALIDLAEEQQVTIGFSATMMMVDENGLREFCEIECDTEQEDKVDIFISMVH